MRRSKIEVYLHFVWAVKGREPLLTPQVEAAVHRCIQSEAQSMKCVVLALDGMPDHVHLLIKPPATLLPLSEFMKRIKGVSSAFANDLPPRDMRFRWQEGYAVYAVCPSHKPTVIDYIRNQKQHHANGTLTGEWEETDEEVPEHPAS